MEALTPAASFWGAALPAFPKMSDRTQEA
jgi:hypothetical protein